MSFDVINAFVDGAELVVRHRVDGQLREHRCRAEYAFFVKKSEMTDDFAHSLRGSRAVVAMRDEGSYVRIVWSDDWARKAMLYGRKDEHGVRRPSPFQERGITVYEGDVHPVRRWFTDTGATISKPRRAYYDLETDSRQGVVATKAGSARVLCWALVNEDCKVVARGCLEADTDDAERRLILDYFKAAGAFDQLAAWSGDDFDEPVLEKRAARLGLREVDKRHWLWLDHLKLYKRMNLNSAESGAEKQSMKLNAIAFATLGEGKEEVPDFVAKRWPGKSLAELSWDLWAAGGEYRDVLTRYNDQDTVLLAKIERETGFIALFDTLADVCRVLPDSRGLLPTQQMDGFMLRLGAERDYRFPTREWKERGEDDDENDPFKGAFVMDPKEKGILKDVHVADFASLYPSIILTWNMSPETKVGRARCKDGDDFSLDFEDLEEGTCRSPLTGIEFTTEIEGILPYALRVMIAMRKEWKIKAAACPAGSAEAKSADRRSTAYKVAANSFYGVVGSPFSRYYDREVAESVTQNGVWLITKTIEEAEKRGMRVIYGDTDSFFATNTSQTEMEMFVKWSNAELYPALLESVGCRAEHRAVLLDYEKAFARIVIVTAKRYAGVFLHKKGQPPKPMPMPGEAFDKKRHSKPEIKGLEYKRGDASLLARRLQEETIMDLMRGVDRPDHYRKIVDDVLAHVSKDELPLEEVAVSQSLSKKTSEYHRADGGAVPIHVRVAEQLAASGRQIGEGSRVSFVVIDGSDGLKAIPAEDYRGECDRYYQWEKRVYPPTMRVLQAAFPDQDWETGLERIRPPKARKGHAAPVEQGALFAREVRDQTALRDGNGGYVKGQAASDPVAAAGTIVLEEAVHGRQDVLEMIAAILRVPKGELHATIVLRLHTGAEAVLTTRQKTTPAALESARAAARHLADRAHKQRARQIEWENAWLA